MLEGGSQYGVPPPEAEMASPITTLSPHQFSSFPSNGIPPDEEEDHGGGAASSGGGNRWPRQETLTLLRIRSEMDAVFRDATLKAPLWEEVSRKLAELGYKRSAKKCKEKFENVHKYYKRTKEGRAGRQDGKNYRFFSQLEALSSGGAAGHPVTNSLTPAAIPNLSEASTSSNDSDSDGGADRKMMSFFKGLIRQVVDRQEAMQNRFLETIEKREQERMMREEAWRRQDMARLARDHEAATHDRAVAAARDAAIITFLQQLVGQPPPPPPAQPSDDGGAASSLHKAAAAVAAGGRWPKAEVQALIKLRGEMEIKYQEIGPKGPLWEEISSEMRRLGYNRSAKRCKEKWENINKYFKKVKESNKRRPEDSKTCPYFHQLDALYRRKRTPAAMDGGTASPDDGGTTSSKAGEGVMELTSREEDGQRANSEDMVSDEGGKEDEQYKIEYQPNSGVNGNINGGSTVYGHNSVKIQDQRSDLSPVSTPLFQA